MSPPHRDQIEALVAEYSQKPQAAWPRWLKDPKSEYQFSLAMCLVLATEPRYVSAGAGPEYDADGFLAGFRGIRLRGQT